MGTHINEGGDASASSQPRSETELVLLPREIPLQSARPFSILTVNDDPDGNRRQYRHLSGSELKARKLLPVQASSFAQIQEESSKFQSLPTSYVPHPEPYDSLPRSKTHVSKDESASFGDYHSVTEGRVPSSSSLTQTGRSTRHSRGRERHKGILVYKRGEVPSDPSKAYYWKELDGSFTRANFEWVTPRSREDRGEVRVYQS
jgi:hypothetical protein